MADFKTNYKRITHFPDCIGKTIEDVVDDFDAIGFRFTDGFYLWCKVILDWGDCPNIETNSAPPGAGVALVLGLIDEAEFDRIKAEQDEEQKRQDLLEFERLRAKLGDQAI
jgi:hypothetical protein